VAILLNCLDQFLLHVEHSYLLRFDVRLTSPSSLISICTASEGATYVGMFAP
jgi:hypothetical protein